MDWMTIWRDGRSEFLETLAINDIHDRVVFLNDKSFTHHQLGPILLNFPLA